MSQNYFSKLAAVAIVIIGGFNSLLISPAAFAQSSATQKIPIPDAAALKEAQKQVNGVFGEDLAKAKKPEEKAALAKKLLQNASETKKDAAGRYFLLCTSRDLAAGACDVEDTLAAIAALDQYAIDGMKMKLEALTTASQSTRAAECSASLIAATNQTLDDAIAADRYDVAASLAGLVTLVARSSNTATARVQEVRDLQAAYAQTSKALETLAAKPDDPEANLTAGKFYCFIKGDWSKGLPMLAHGSEATLKSLAGKELAAPAEAKKQVEIANAWWDLAAKEKGPTKRMIVQHAAFWYERALPNVSGVTKLLVLRTLRHVKAQETTDSIAGWVLGRTKRPNVIVFNGEAGRVGVTLFQRVAAARGGKADLLEITPENMTDATKLSDAGIVVWGPNTIRSTPTVNFTDKWQKDMVDFVRSGGDFVLFEQRDAEHTNVIKSMFDITVGAGGGHGVMIRVVELLTRVLARGIDLATLNDIRFYNTYGGFPKNSVVLLAGANDSITGVVVPFGMGRIVLIGTDLNANERLLSEVIIDLLYHMPDEQAKQAEVVGTYNASNDYQYKLLPMGEVVGTKGSVTVKGLWQYSDGRVVIKWEKGIIDTWVVTKDATWNATGSTGARFTVKRQNQEF